MCTPEEVRQGQKVTNNDWSGLHAMHICTLNRVPDNYLQQDGSLICRAVGLPVE